MCNKGVMSKTAKYKTLVAISFANFEEIGFAFLNTLHHSSNTINNHQSWMKNHEISSTYLYQWQSMHFGAILEIFFLKNQPWQLYAPCLPSALRQCKFTLEIFSQCAAPPLCVAPFTRCLLEAFPVSKLRVG